MKKLLVGLVFGWTAMAADQNAGVDTIAGTRTWKIMSITYKFDSGESNVVRAVRIVRKPVYEDKTIPVHLVETEWTLEQIKSWADMREDGQDSNRVKEKWLPRMQDPTAQANVLGQTARDTFRILAGPANQWMLSPPPPKEEEPVVEEPPPQASVK